MSRHLLYIIVLSVFGMTQTIPALAQVQPEMFSYPVGLNPKGDNWLALRSLPSATEGVRLAKLGPETLFAEIERENGWVKIRLLDGAIGWVSARYVGCCRAATLVSPNEDQPVSEPQSVAAPNCDELWYRRNSIFKVAGYCFRTPRGISAFGNAGCQYDNEADVPLSVNQREEVARIRQQERYRGCGG